MEPTLLAVIIAAREIVNQHYSDGNCHGVMILEKAIEEYDKHLDEYMAHVRKTLGGVENTK